MSALEVIGTSVKRVEGRPKVTGQARFSDDLRLHDLLYVRLVLSPYAHARIVGIDPSAALALPGVEVVLRAGDAYLEQGVRHWARNAGDGPADRYVASLYRVGEPGTTFVDANGTPVS